MQCTEQVAIEFARCRPSEGPFEDFNEISVKSGHVTINRLDNFTLIIESVGAPITLCQWGKRIYVNYKTKFLREETFDKIEIRPYLAHSGGPAHEFHNNYKSPDHWHSLAQIQLREEFRCDANPIDWDAIDLLSLWDNHVALMTPCRKWSEYFPGVSWERLSAIYAAYAQSVDLIEKSLPSQTIDIDPNSDTAPDFCAHRRKFLASIHADYRDQIMSDIRNSWSLMSDVGFCGQQDMHDRCAQACQMWREKDEGRLKPAQSWELLCLPPGRNQGLLDYGPLFFNCGKNASVTFLNKTDFCWELHGITIRPRGTYIVKTPK